MRGIRGATAAYSALHHTITTKKDINYTGNRLDQGPFSKGWCCLCTGVKLLHMPVPLHLRLIPVDTPFRLAGEGQQILVNDLGSQAVASMPLGSLDVLVHQTLRLESLTTTFIGAGEWALACVIHHM